MRFLVGTVLLFSVMTAGTAEAQQCDAPNVMVLFDVSGSMNNNNKYTTAINGLDNALVSLEDKAQFGLGLFPDPSQAYCFISTTGSGALAPHVAPALNNRNTIHSLLFSSGSNYFGGPKSTFDTPIYQVLDAAGQWAIDSNQSQLSYLVLVTDGVQDCYRFGDYDNENDHGSAEMIENRGDIENLAGFLYNTYGVQIYAVGFGAQADPETLARIAIASHTQKSGCNLSSPTSCFYLASDSAGLTNALSAIVQQISVDVCDGLDNDCDGWVDNVPGTTNRVTKSCSTSCENGIRWCDSAVGSGTESWSSCTARLPSTEICDTIDNNCNGTLNEGLVRSCNDLCGNSQTCTQQGTWTTCPSCSCSPPGSTRSCGPTTVNTGSNSHCKLGTQTCSASNQWGGCAGAVYPTTEICNGIDDDCDGDVDENDSGGDLTQACQHECGPSSQTCVNGDWGECAAPNPTCMSACGPGHQCIGGHLAPECVPDAPPTQICNGVYNQCNVRPTENCDCDNGDERPCGSENGECSQGKQKCVYGVWSICIGGDQGRPEQCNNIDDNCNGLIDDGDNLCDAGYACVCGTCQPACDAQGVCQDGGACVEGSCHIDYCPQGQVCKDQRCTAGEPDLPQVTPTITPKVKEPAPAVPQRLGNISGGCGCHSSEQDWPSHIAALLLGAGWLLRRRSTPRE